MGEVLSYILRPNEKMKAHLNKIEERLSAFKYPVFNLIAARIHTLRTLRVILELCFLSIQVAALHVRRTDHIHEAPYQAVPLFLHLSGKPSRS